MKQEISTGIDWKPGKYGIQVQLTTDLLAFVTGALQEINKAWNEAEDLAGFWESLPFSNAHSDAKYGDRKWVAMSTDSTHEFRVTIARKPNGRLMLDFKDWWS
jgi:hypothetical protein